MTKKIHVVDWTSNPIYEFKWPNDPCQVILGDLSFEEVNSMMDYCEEFDIELESFKQTDVSDASGQYDTLATFKFKNKEDALIFRLKFKCK